MAMYHSGSRTTMGESASRDSGPQGPFPARGDPEPPRMPTRGDRSLPAILGLELEDVLQSIYAARQDVLALADAADLDEARQSAERTLSGCAATVQLLLRLVRVAAADHPPNHPFVAMMSGPFGVLGRDYEVLYLNTAMGELIGLQHRTIALSRFEDRRWIDRGLMREHLDHATAAGAAAMQSILVAGDGRRTPVRVETARIDGHREPLLLISIKPVPLLPPAD